MLIARLNPLATEVRRIVGADFAGVGVELISLTFPCDTLRRHM